MNRDRMIHALVLEYVHRIEDGRFALWLMTSLEQGFAGFGTMSDAELRQEIAKWGLTLETEQEAAGEEQQMELTADFYDDYLHDFDFSHSDHHHHSRNDQN